MAEVSTQVPHRIYGGRSVESHTFWWGLGLYHNSVILTPSYMQSSVTLTSNVQVPSIKDETDIWVPYRPLENRDLLSIM